MSLPSRRGGYTRRLSGRRAEARGEEAAAALAGFAPGRYQLHYPVGTACCRACNLRAAPSSAAPIVGAAAPGQAALMVEARIVEGVAWLRTAGGGWVRQWVHQPGGEGLLEGGLKEYGWHRCEERPQQVGEGWPPGCVEDECAWAPCLCEGTQRGHIAGWAVGPGRWACNSSLSLLLVCL